MMKIIYREEKILNIPNIISFYRLAMFPVILWLAIRGYESLFVTFLCINLVGDILDGFIARHFHQVTRFGGALDNVADVGTFIPVFYGIYRFKWPDIHPHAWMLYIFLSIFLLSYVFAFIKFRKIPGLHLYSVVTAGYIQGFFFFILFVWGFNHWFYFIAVGVGILSYIEKIIVLLYIDDIKPGVKGLYWILNKS